MMRLSKISVTNMCGIKKFESDLPSVCVVSGPHGSGKSSIEKAIMYCLGRRPLAEKGGRAVQHDPSMLHGNAEVGEALLTFSEDSDAEFLRVRVKPDSTERRVKMRGAKKMEDAAEFIDSITSALAYDPMQLKKMAPKERVESFLRAVPLEIDRNEVLTAADTPGFITSVPEKPGLDTINSIYDSIYKARTAENVAADTQAKHADQLEAALPPPAPTGDWNAEATKLRADKATLEASEAEEIRRIGGELQTKKHLVAQARKGSNDGIDADINAKIAKLEADRATRKKVAEQTESSAVEFARAQANAEATEIRANNAPLHFDLASRVTVADERARSAAQAEGTRNAAATARAEATARKAKAKAMTEALERLTALKATVGGRMKIPGVTIASPREGQPVDICRVEDGALVPFSVWNDADSDGFCIKLSILYRGPCGIVCIDNMGNWSPARQARVIDRCKELAAEHGMQFLLGKATDVGELLISDATKELA